MAARRASRKPKPEVDDLAGPEPTRGRCTKKTDRGTRCKRLAAPGAKLCAQHLGKPYGKSPGRPTKLQRDVVEQIVAVLRDGGYAETAAAAAGISKQTFYNWIERGDPDGAKKADAAFREFREQVEQAQAEGEAAHVALIARAALKDWKASAWLLERRYPDRFAGPRGRGVRSTIHPDDFAAGETSSSQDVIDDQVGPDGRPL